MAHSNRDSHESLRREIARLKAQLGRLKKTKRKIHKVCDKLLFANASLKKKIEAHRNKSRALSLQLQRLSLAALGGGDRRN